MDNFALVDLVCPSCYAEGMLGYIFAGRVHFGEAVEYSCPQCQKEYRYRLDLEGDGQTFEKMESTHGELSNWRGI